jgi:hypothetical protein
MSDTVSDEIYYAHAGKLSFLRSISANARMANFRLFEKVMHPGRDTTILDVGVSDEITVESNMLEQMHPHRDRIVCASLGDGAGIVAAYPGIRHERIEAGKRLPFSDGEFGIAYSNAVLEHVGSVENQRAFIHELCRVGKRVFLAVPNRLFPVEHHTALPLVHWLPKPVFRGLMARSRWKHWSTEENLNHIGATALRNLFPQGRIAQTAYSGLGFGPFRSNLVAFEA